MNNKNKKSLIYRIGYIYAQISVIFTSIVMLALAVKVLHPVTQFIFSLLSWIFKVN